MAIRHKAYKATLDRGYADEWNDDHHIDFTDELVDIDAFVFVPFATRWNTSQCATGTATQALVSNHLYVTADSGNVSDGHLGTCRLANGDVTNKLDLPVVTMAIVLEDDEKIEFGFFKNADTPFTANQDGAYFELDANVLYAVTGDGAAETRTDVTTTPWAVPEYHIFRIEFTTTQVKFYVDNLAAPVATHTANITPDNLTIKISAMRTGGVQQIIRMDGCGLQRLRKQ